MTLNEALEKSRRFLTEFWEEHEAAMMTHLSDAGATDDELAVSLSHSRETLADELRKASQQITAIWLTGDAGIH